MLVTVGIIRYTTEVLDSRTRQSYPFVIITRLGFALTLIEWKPSTETETAEVSGGNHVVYSA